MYSARKIAFQKTFAVKVIAVANAKSRQRARSEAAVTRRLGSSCPHIVTVMETFVGKDLLYIVMEKCDNTLLRWLQNSDMREITLKNAVTDVLVGVAFLHSQNVIHRDVKPDNLLVSKSFALQRDVVKLCDFGMAVELSAKMTSQGRPPATRCIDQICGTGPFMSPEMLRGGYNEKTDVWSVGVTTYVLFLGDFPYIPESKDPEAMKRCIAVGQPAPTFRSAVPGIGPSQGATDFVASLLQRRPGSRPSAGDALKQPYMIGDLANECGAQTLRPILQSAEKNGAFSVSLGDGRSHVEATLGQLQAHHIGQHVQSVHWTPQSSELHVAKERNASVSETSTVETLGYAI